MSVAYIGYEEAASLSEVQNIIADEVNATAKYTLKNTIDGDIIFPTNALHVGDIRLTKLAE